MTSLRDKASGGGPEIVRVGDQPHRPPVAILSGDLVDCDELTDEGEFPEFGQFLEVETAHGDVEYWESPKALAQVIVGEADESGVALTELGVDVETVVKTPNGEWRYTAHCGPVDGWDELEDR